MALGSGTRLANLCRVCIQDVTYVPSDSIFESTDQGSLSIHGELVVICPQVFSEESAETKPLADDAPGLPSKVCINCRFKIDEAYKLHQMCLETNRKLWKMLAAPAEADIKDESEDGMPTEPLTQLELPDESADYLVDFSEQSSPEAVEPKMAKSKVKRTILKTSKAEPAEKSNSDPEKKVKKKMGRPRKYPDQSERYQVKDKPADQTTPKYHCEKCGLGTRAENKLHLHIKLRHSDEAVKCDQCTAAFFNEAALEEHKLVHTLAKPYPCPDCKKMFTTRRNVRLHQIRCSGSTPYMCSECGKAFSYRASLAQHVARHREKTFACDRCPSKFYLNGALQAHMLSHIQTKEVPCDICGKLFTTKYNLAKHMKAKHSGDERPHACDLCSLRFKTSNKLKRHMLIHTGEKPYKCTECDRAFAQSNDLVKHSKTHFGDNPYKCDRCDAAFRLLTDLRNHYKEHCQTGESQESDLPDAVDFTSYSIFKRLAEQEKRNDPRKDNQSSGGPNGAELNFV